MTPKREVKNLTRGREQVLAAIAAGGVTYRFKVGLYDGLSRLGLPRNAVSSIDWCVEQGLAVIDSPRVRTLADLDALGPVPVRLTAKGGRALGFTKAVLRLVHGGVVIVNRLTHAAYGPVEARVAFALLDAGLAEPGRAVVASGSDTTYLTLTENGRSLMGLVEEEE